MKNLKVRIFALFFFSLLFSQVTVTKTIDAEKAHEMADRFLERRCQTAVQLQNSSSFRQIEQIVSLQARKQTQPPAYLARLQPTGFIIISPDSTFPPILAYSFRHKWPADTSSSNLIYQTLIRDLELRFTARATGNIPEDRINENRIKWQQWQKQSRTKKSIHSFMQWPAPGSTPTGGWVATTWTQTGHFNRYCPLDPGTNERTYVGCVATGMAQIVNYHQLMGDILLSKFDQYNARGIQIDSDSSNYDFPSFHWLNGIAKKIQEKYSHQQPLSESEEAALCFICGILLKMEYSSYASRTYTRLMASVLPQKLDFHQAKLATVTGNFYFDLKQNMIHRLPAQLSVANSINNAGHSIIVDGYNTDGFYHLNFGWGSESPAPIPDAWYHLPEFIPADYNIIKYGVINIQPVKKILPQLEISSKSIQFPATCIGEKSSIRQVTLQNYGDVDLFIDYVVPTANFYISSDSIQFVDSLSAMILTVDAGKTIFIQCQPDSFGALNGELIIVYEHGIGFQTVELLAYGVPSNGTLVPRGNVSGIWKPANSPYYVTGDISVAKGKPLFIQPGVKVLFGGPHSLTVGQYANLNARGTIADSIFFLPEHTHIGWEGIKFSDSAANDTLDYCCISGVNHRRSNRWAAVTVQNSTPHISHSKISNSHGINGGGLAILNAAPTIRNTLFTGNSAHQGAAVFCQEGEPDLKNVIIVNNSAQTGGAICLNNRNHLQLKNSIIRDNQASQGAALAFIGSFGKFNHAQIDFSNIDTSGTNWIYRDQPQLPYILWGNGNISEPPLFADPAQGDYSLLPESPGVDGGDPNDDVGKEPMPHGFRVNQGIFGGTEWATTSEKPSLNICPNPVDFGSSVFYQEKQITVYLKNGSVSPVRIVGVQLNTAEFFSLAPGSLERFYQDGYAIIEPGQIDSLIVRFYNDGLIAANARGQLTITSLECPEYQIEVLASPNFSGEIFGIFQQKNSPFEIIGDLLVPAGKTLQFEPGVELKFMGPYHLQVGENARLVARGTINDSVKFCAGDAEVGWGGIVFSKSGNDDSLAYCTITGCKWSRFFQDIPCGALTIRESSPIITHCRIASNTGKKRGAALSCTNASPFIACTSFEKNDVSSELLTHYLQPHKTQRRKIILSYFDLS